MTQKDKELLLKDLCARLPYGVIIQEYNEEHGYSDNELNTIGIGYFSIHEASVEGTWINRIENVRPYLRPMSSMTEEEKEELYHYYCNEIADNLNTSNLTWEIRCCISNSFGTDWLNAHHFDYRGLIENGLALEAPEGMYNLKK